MVVASPALQFIVDNPLFVSLRVSEGDSDTNDTAPCAICVKSQETFVGRVVGKAAERLGAMFSPLFKKPRSRTSMVQR